MAIGHRWPRRGRGRFRDNQGGGFQGQNRPSGQAQHQLSAAAATGLSETTRPRIRFWDELTTIDPQPRLTLEYPGCPASCRLVDLFCPIGRGQRSLIVSPPKAGKTTLLKDIGTAILRNHPDVELIILLVDERPEEVTDFRRTFLPSPRPGTGEAAADQPPATEGVDRSSRVHVVASSNDQDRKSVV